MPEVVVERQQMTTRILDGSSDPDVVDRNRSARTAKLSEDLSVSAGRRWSDRCGSDEGLVEELAEHRSVLFRACAELESGLELTQDDHRKVDYACRGNEVENQLVAVSEA